MAHDVTHDLAHLWLHEVMQYTHMEEEEEISYCVVHLGFPMPRQTVEGMRWAAWEIDRWQQSHPQ